MLRRFNKLLLVLVVVAAALYIVLLNDAPTTVFLTPRNPISANTGVILIVAFVIGLVAASLVGLWFGTKAYLRERNLLGKERQRQQFYNGLLAARSAVAAAEWSKARELWEGVVRRDPTDLIARIELSRTLEGLGDTREALRVLEIARAKHPLNIELLFRAAELNIQQQNCTAALDNLALIIGTEPNQRALVMARDLSERLERFEDALEYHRKLEERGASDAETDTASRLKYQQLLKDHSAGTDGGSDLREQLRAFIKREGNFPPALNKLAELESEAGRIDDAAQLYLKAAKAGGSVDSWQQAARLWVKHHMPERALAAARAATNETRGMARITAEIELIRLYIALNMLDDAKRLLDGINALCKREQIQPADELQQTWLALRGLCLNRMGDFKQSAEVWKKLSARDFELVPILDSNDGADSKVPSPRLSTP